MMVVPERNREALPKKMNEVPEVSNEQILEAIHEMKDIQMQLADYMEGLKSHQTVQTDKLSEHSAQYKDVLGALAQSEVARTKANETFAATNKELKAATSEVINMVNNHKKAMDALLTERERKLDEAINEAKRLRPDMQEGFGRLVRENKSSPKQRLMQVFAVAICSTLSAVILSLVFVIWYQGDFHKPAVSTTKSTTTSTHHTTNKKTK